MFQITEMVRKFGNYILDLQIILDIKNIWANIFLDPTVI